LGKLSLPEKMTDTSLLQYYEDEAEFKRYESKVHSLSCPHCFRTGYLILHGWLYGYQESSCRTRVRRGHRIFCSNRNNRNGCGRTFSMLHSLFIKGFSITTTSLWAALKAVMGSLAICRVFDGLNTTLSKSTAYNIMRRFREQQYRIRSLLLRLNTPPVSANCTQPHIQTIAHLEKVFCKMRCPISAFQETFQVSFI
jgi:hypothetical protein